MSLEEWAETLTDEELIRALTLGRNGRPFRRAGNRAMKVTATNGRDATGKLSAGNPGGPGRPRRETQRGYLSALATACTLDDWREIVARAVMDAKDGNAKAQECLASYLVGTPKADAATLHALAVVDLRGIDPVADEAETQNLWDGLHGLR